LLTKHIQRLLKYIINKRVIIKIEEVEFVVGQQQIPIPGVKINICQ
jgi:hypothetical protein